jgi:hypothetical protein
MNHVRLGQAGVEADNMEEMIWGWCQLGRARLAVSQQPRSD